MQFCIRERHPKVLEKRADLIIRIINSSYGERRISKDLIL